MSFHTKVNQSARRNFEFLHKYSLIFLAWLTSVSSKDQSLHAHIYTHRHIYFNRLSFSYQFQILKKDFTGFIVHLEIPMQ